MVDDIVGAKNNLNWYGTILKDSDLKDSKQEIKTKTYLYNAYNTNTKSLYTALVDGVSVFCSRLDILDNFKLIVIQFDIFWSISSLEEENLLAEGILGKIYYSLKNNALFAKEIITDRIKITNLKCSDSANNLLPSGDMEVLLNGYADRIESLTVAQPIEENTVSNWRKRKLGI